MSDLTRDPGAPPVEGEAAIPSVRPVRSGPPSVRPRPAKRAPEAPRHPWLLPIAGLYAALLFVGALMRHRHFGSPTFELGAYHSVLWNVAFRGSPWNSLERVHQWSNHLELGLAVLVPFYRIVPSPVWLWLAESLSCAAVALPVDALARRITKDPFVGLIAALAALLAPAMVLGQLADFHVLALCALPVAVMAWAIEVDSSRALAAGAAWAMMLREQMGVVVAVAAIFWVIRQGRRRAPPAAALGVVALVFSALEIFVIIPAFGSGQSFHYVAHYANLGAGPDEAVRAAAERPMGVVGAIFDARRARYLAELLSGAAPLAFLALRSLRRSAWPLMLALPQLAIQLVASSARKFDLHYPYGMPAVPLIAAAALLSLAFVPIDRWRGARRWAVGGWLALTLLHLAGKLQSPVGPGRPIDRAFEGSARAAALAKAIAAVPPEASISAQDDVVPHVAARSEVHLWPDGRNTDDYILLDMDGAAATARNPLLIVDRVRSLRGDPRFEVVVDSAGVILAKRLPR